MAPKFHIVEQMHIANLKQKSWSAFFIKISSMVCSLTRIDKNTSLVKMILYFAVFNTKIVGVFQYLELRGENKSCS